MSKESGTDFDRRYVESQIKDHGQTVKEFEKYIAKAGDADLKRFAEKTLPTLKEHQRQIHALAEQTGSKKIGAGRLIGGHEDCCRIGSQQQYCVTDAPLARDLNMTETIAMNEQKYGESQASQAGGSPSDLSGTSNDLDQGRVVMGTSDYGMTSPAQDYTTTGTTASSESGARIVGGDEAAASEGPGPQVMAADTLEGDDVVNSQGDDLGEIKDIMIDVRSGRIAYAVLASSGFLGIGKKLFAIPWNALTLDADRKCFVLDIDKETLSNAPGFDKDHWPSMADERWATEIHSYYHTRPYWQSRTGV